MTKSFQKYTGCKTYCTECAVIYVTNDKANTFADYYINMTDEELNYIDNLKKFYLFLQPIEEPKTILI